MSFGPDMEEEEDLAGVRAKFIELWAKYPDREPLEIAQGAFRLMGLDPGFRYAQYGYRWGSDFDVMAARDAARLTARTAEGVADKEEILSEMLTLARDPKIDPKERHNFYKTVLEAQGHIVKNVAKTTADVTERRPPIIHFHEGIKPAAEDEAAA